MTESAELLEHFLTHLRVERGLSPATQSAYRYQIESYLRDVAKQGSNIAASTKETIVAHIGSRQRVGLKPSSIFHLALAIRQFHRFLFAEKLLKIDPTAGLKLPKFQHIIPEPLSVVQMGALLTPLVSVSFASMRTKTMIDTAYNLGLRVSELVNLKIGDVNFEEGFVRVRRGKGGRDRLVPFGQTLKETLLRYVEARNRQPNATSPHLFLSARGRPISRGTFWWLLKRWANRAGIKGRVSPHQLRHSFATHLLNGGANLRGIQAALGHRDIRQTQIYSHVDMTFLRETLQHHPRFSN
ncbi:MAG: Tyrosine recombinase XerD [Elusimicrobia bacterium]|nr:Tyrosine recombinase XerD [Elusimicrobiota bacterium]